MSRRTTPNRVGSPNRTDTSAVGVRSPTRMYRPPSREAMQLERLEQSHQHQMTVELEAAASSAYRDEVRLARQQQLDAKRGHVAQMRESVYQRSHASRPSVASQLEATRVSDTLADDRLHAAMEAKVGRLTYLREHARATRLFAAARCELKRREAQQASLVTLQSLVPEGDDRQRASTPLITVNKQQQQQQQQSSSSYLERQQQSRQRTVRDTMRLVQRQDQKEVPRHVSSPPAASRSSSPPRRESSPDRRMNIDDGVGVDWTGAGGGGGVGSRPVSRAASTPMNASSSSSRPQLLRSSSRQSNRSIASNQSTSTVHRDQFLVQHKRVSSRSSSSAQERRASLPPLRNSGAPSGYQASASSSQHSGVEDPTDSVDHVVAHTRPSVHHRPPPPQERRPNSRNEDEAAKFQSHSRNMLRHLLLGPSSTSSSLDPLSAARTVSQQKALHHQMERSSISTSRNASIVLQMSKAHVCPPVFCAREGVEAYRTSVESSAMQQAAATLKALGPTRAKPSTPSTAVVVARRPLQAQGRQRRANPPDPMPESVDWLPATVEEDIDEADAATPQSEMPLPYPTHHRSYYYDEDDANEEENVLVFPMHASLNRDDRSDGGGGDDSSSVSPIRKNNNGGGMEEDASHLGYVEDNDEFTVRSDNDVHRQIYGSGSSTSTSCSSDDEDEDEEERRIGTARNKEPEHNTPREHAAAATTPSHSPPVEDLKMAHLMQEKRELVDLVKREERVESQSRSRSPQKEPTSTSSGTDEQHEATASTRAFQSVDDEHVRRREELETLRHKLIAHHGGAGGNAKTYAHHPQQHTNDFSGFDSDHSTNHQPLQTNNNNNNNNLNAEVVPAKKYSPIQEDLSFDAMCFVQGNFEVQRLFTPPPHVQHVSASSQGRGTSVADDDEEDNPFPKPPSDMAHFMDFGSSSSSASSSRSATPPRLHTAGNGSSPRAPSFGNLEEDRCLDQTIELEEEVGKDVVPQEPQPRQQVASSSTSQQQHELFVEDICETVVANAQERHSRESSRGEGEEPASSPELHETQNEGDSNLREVPPQQQQSSAAASTRTVVTYPSLPSPVAAMTSLEERPSADVLSPLSEQWSECSMSPHTKAEAMRSVEWCSEEDEEGEQEGSWRSLAKHTVLMVIRKVTDKKQAFLK